MNVRHIAGTYWVRARRHLRAVASTVVVLILLVGSATVASAQAQAPGWSRGQQDLPISYDECLRRAALALTAERYRTDYAAGNFVVGIKQVHTAVIICGPAPNSRMLIQIVVASNGEGGGLERECLQRQMERPGSTTACSGNAGAPPAPPPPGTSPPPAAPPPAPPPFTPPAATMCSCSTSVPYCISVRAGVGPEGLQGVFVYFGTPVPRYGGALGVPDYVGLFEAGTRDGLVSYQRNEGLQRCPMFFTSVKPGKYEFRYIEGAGYEPVRASVPVTATADGVYTTGAVGLSQERTSPACGLGTRWIEREEGWTGTWTRRGKSNVFDLYATKSGLPPLTAVLTMTITGNRVSINRTNTSDGNDCVMEGTVGPDGVHVTGTYRCRSGGPYQWKAEIQCQ